MIRRGSYFRDDEMPLRADERLEQLSKAIANLDDDIEGNTLRDDADMDSWVVSYLDAIMVILAVFTFLISLMEMPQPRREAITEELRKTMEYPALMDLPLLKIETEEARNLPDAEGLVRTIKENGLEQVVDISIRNGIATMLIGESVLYAPGEAALSPRGEDVIRSLAAALDELQGEITVEGHTDNTPIESDRFGSNWHLAAARAISVVSLLSSLGIPPDRFRAVSYGETQPIADNKTVEGRAINRRVSISIDLSSASEE